MGSTISNRGRVSFNVEKNSGPKIKREMKEKSLNYYENRYFFQCLTFRLESSLYFINFITVDI